MAPVPWSDLPGGILDIISSKLSDSDIDLLRVRSICSSWRSSVSPPPKKRFSFPVNVPPVSSHSEVLCYNRNKGCSKADDGFYKLYENTLYRISSPHDPSNGWLFKVSETTPNTFSLLFPFSMDDKIKYPPGTIPKHLNLLDYRISVISKSYRVKGVNCDGIPRDIVVLDTVKKIIILFDYVMDCDFVALALEHEIDGYISYCKFGDEKFTRIDTEGRKIHDVILYDGRCYLIDGEGVLFYLDSSLQLSVAAPSPGNYREGQHHFLVKCDSGLYVASKTWGRGPEFFRHYVASSKSEMGFTVMLNKFNKCDGNWICVEDLGDKVFLLCKDGSVGVSAKDFQGCKGNCVYLTDVFFYDDNQSEVYGGSALTYHFDTRIAVKMATDGDSRKLHWPPPNWLMANASSFEP